MQIASQVQPSNPLAPRLKHPQRHVVRNTIRAGVAVVVLSFGLIAPVAAGPFEEAVAAYERGDYATAMQLFRLPAKKGDARAQYNLGLMYAAGHGVPQNDATAVSWYRKAADQGHAAGQYNLGIMYADGRGVRQDYAAALKWYRKAADQGYAGAQLKLGLMYENGHGVPQDDAAAVSWFQKAANQGLAEGQNDLGFMYGNGRGVPHDFAAAAGWYRKAADQGLASAQYNLGLLYSNGGKGLSQDLISAYMWFSLAAEAGYQDAVKNLNIVAPWIPPAQIAEAKKLIAAWRSARLTIPLQHYGGAFAVPVSINDKLTLNFVLDSGAADVSIPADVVKTLMQTGTLLAGDFLGNKTYRLADGSTVPSQTFRIKSMKVGEKIIENVTGSIAPGAGDPLLGQTFLRRFKSWSIDNQRQVLVLE